VGTEQLGPSERRICLLSKNQKKAAPDVDRALPSIAKPTVTDAEKVSVARDIVSTAQKNPGWSTATDLQAAAKVWSQSADAIEANASTIVARRSDLRTAEAKQRSLRRAWRAAKKQVMGTVDVLCAGSADELKAFGFGVQTHSGLGPLAVPDGLSTAPGTALGQAVFSWSKGLCRHGFLVQHAADAANQATYSPVIACTKSKFTLTGAQSGSSMSFRVAAIDPSSPTGQTAWTGWVAGTVR
jgi:hypothetical protein